MPNGGNTPVAFIAKKPAAMSSAAPMKIWMGRRGSRLTTPAPIQAPAPALITMLLSQSPLSGAIFAAYRSLEMAAKTRRVAVVGDDPGVLRALRRLLRSADFEVEVIFQEPSS